MDWRAIGGAAGRRVLIWLLVAVVIGVIRHLARLYGGH